MHVHSESSELESFIMGYRELERICIIYLSYEEISQMKTLKNGNFKI